jgi:hypothetical protein
MDKSETKRR